MLVLLGCGGGRGTAPSVDGGFDGGGDDGGLDAGGGPDAGSAIDAGWACAADDDCVSSCCDGREWVAGSPWYCAEPVACEGRLTRLEGCDAIAVGWCDAYVACKGGISQAECVGLFVDGCCRDVGECGDESWGDTTTLETCLSETAAAGCDAIAKGAETPPACLAFYGVP